MDLPRRAQQEVKRTYEKSLTLLSCVKLNFVFASSRMRSFEVMLLYIHIPEKNTLFASILLARAYDQRENFALISLLPTYSVSLTCNIN